MHTTTSRGRVAILIFIGFLIGADRVAMADVAADKVAIQKMLDRYAHALNDSDLNTVLTLYTKDGIFMPSHKPTSSGLVEIKTAYQLVFDTLDFDVNFHTREIVPTGSIAYARTVSGGHIKLIGKGDTIANQSRELFILEKHQGVWKIARYMFNEYSAPKE